MFYILKFFILNIIYLFNFKKLINIYVYRIYFYKKIKIYTVIYILLMMISQLIIVFCKCVIFNSWCNDR